MPHQAALFPPPDEISGLLLLRVLPLCLTVGLLIAAGDDGPSTAAPVTPPPIHDTPATPMLPLWPKFGEFTDSQGRTITYGLHLREEWDSNQPRGLVIFFHGNNFGTQERMSKTRWFDHEIAYNLGLAVAAVGAPEAVEDRGGTTDFSPYFQNRVGSGRGIRFWVVRGPTSRPRTLAERILMAVSLSTTTASCSGADQTARHS